MNTLRLWWADLITVPPEPALRRGRATWLLCALALISCVGLWIMFPQQRLALRTLQQTNELWEGTTLVRSVVVALLCLVLAGLRTGHPANPAQRQQGQILIIVTQIALVVVVLGLLSEGLSSSLMLSVWAYLTALSLYCQVIWLARRGYIALAGSLLAATLVAQALVLLRSPVLLNFVAMYAIAVAVAGLLVRWWVCLLVNALYIPLLFLGQSLVPDLRQIRETTIFGSGLMLLLLATLVVLYARSFARALNTSTEQTLALQQSQALLEHQRDQLAHQATELEQARSTLQEVVAQQEQQIASAVKTIQARSVELVNIQTPLIRVMPGVLVAPMIGTWNSDRSDRFLEQVLNYIAVGHFRVIVLDLTGLTTISTEVAGVITNLLQAARLLGCRGVLVGIHPETAQTLVALNLSFDQVQVAADLAEALATVMRLEAAKRATPTDG